MNAQGSRAFAPSKRKTEYQHYVPRFLLKNFSIQKNNKKSAPPVRPHNPLLHAVELNEVEPEFKDELLAKSFGEDNMYMDDSKFSYKDQRRIETKLGKLEGSTSFVINRIVEAHKNGKNEVVLTRAEKDRLRKFLFVMKYRSQIFFRRFNHQKAEDYNADDKEEFCAYMQEKQFKRPLDVWFDNLTAILDTDVDTQEDWVMHLSGQLYPGDYSWLFANIYTKYLAICTPSIPDEEFILTRNSFCIHEGPMSFSVDRQTGKSTTTSYTEYHNLAVISPYIMILLRCNTMPDPIEDVNEAA